MNRWWFWKKIQGCTGEPGDCEKWASKGHENGGRWASQGKDSVCWTCFFSEKKNCGTLSGLPSAWPWIHAIFFVHVPSQICDPSSAHKVPRKTDKTATCKYGSWYHDEHPKKRMCIYIYIYYGDTHLHPWGKILQGQQENVYQTKSQLRTPLIVWPGYLHYIVIEMMLPCFAKNFHPSFQWSVAILNAGWVWLNHA